jgi:hypothetical protein
MKTLLILIASLLITTNVFASPAIMIDLMTTIEAEGNADRFAIITLHEVLDENCASFLLISNETETLRTHCK